MGLRAEPAFVEGTFNDPDRYRSARWGVPLSPAETDDLDRRHELQEELGPAIAWARASGEFGGLYLDQLRGGEPVFQFTSVPSGADEALRSRLPAGTSYRTENVRWSETQLIAKQEEIERAWSELEADGIDIVRSGIDGEFNRIVIEVDGLTEPESRSLAERFGPMVVNSEGDRARADACNNEDDCWPPMGGVNIYPNGYSTANCTAAYVAKKANGTIVMITAGHCIWGSGGAGTTWKHGSSRVVGESLGFVFNDGVADVGMIEIGSILGQMDLVNQDMKGRSGPDITTLVGTLDGADQFINYMVCRFGTTDFKRCGLIKAKLVANESVATNLAGVTVSRTITKTMELNFDSDGGDSGGPVYSQNGNGIGYGLHVHSWVEGDELPQRSWYSPLDRAKSALLNADPGPNVTISWCLNDPC